MEYNNHFDSRKRFTPAEDEHEYRSTFTPVFSTIILIILAAMLLQQYLGASTPGPILIIENFAARCLNAYALRPLLVFLNSMRKLLRIPVLGSGTLNTLPNMSKLLLGSNIDPGFPAGLGNFDNSCYQNSILQGLSSLPSVRRFFSNMSAEFEALGPDSMVGTLAELLEKLNDVDANGQTLWTPQKLKTMDSVNPQDAHEYFGSMMDFTEKELARALRECPKSNGLKELSETQPIMILGSKETDNSVGQQNREEGVCRYENPLDGLLADRTMCTECGYCEGLRLVSFNCLMTQFPKNLPPWYTFQLGDLLQEYMKLEKVGPTYCARCTLLQNERSLEQLIETCATNGLSSSADFERTARARLNSVQELLASEDFGENDKNLSIRCGIPKKKWAETIKTKQSVVARAPQSLAIHINRSEFDETTWQLRKNTSPVEFPTVQDMSYWTLGGVDATLTNAAEVVQHWKMDPMQSMLPNNDEVRPVHDWQLQYDLRAVVRHQGFGHHNGHYICYRKAKYPFESLDRTEEELDADDNYVKHEKKETDSHSERWWSLSDEDVRPQDERAVLQAPGVFMLFYERRYVDSAPSMVTSMATATATATPTKQALPHQTETTKQTYEHSKSIPVDNTQTSDVRTTELPNLTDKTIPMPALLCKDDHPTIEGESSDDMQSSEEPELSPSATLSESQKRTASEAPVDSDTVTFARKEQHLPRLDQSIEETQGSEQLQKPMHMRTAGTPSKRRRKGESLQMVAPT